ncbi:MAG TPA: ATP-dependent zinc metalloprotease FtsH [Alphaproteobacteria bacterium]|nr:ATP-dependent zinc metalloprotease FtsH [Alphaproteobacteria bacterium]
MSHMPRWLPWALLGLLLAALLFGNLTITATSPVVEVPYSQFKKLIEGGAVAAVTLHGQEASARLRTAKPLGLKGAQVDEVRTRLPPIADSSLMPALEAKDVELTSLPDESAGRSLLYAVLPWLILIGGYWWFWNRMSRNMAGGLGGGRDVTDFLYGSAKREAKGPARVTFADVAGQDNAKREVAELVEFLQNPEQYRKMGAEPPRGILMMGPPGTGKTLLARALAGEAKVPFFYISASEFIELFVGVGASRVRKMFEEAKKRAPSIIFIDELDSIGRMRGAGLGGGHDEREQTLNQILAEMDGFQGHEAVIVLAATNRPDVLDPALLRPGRFDRHVTLELPDKRAREEILKVHVRKVPLADDVSLETIAASTPGFSGAELKNLVNEAAMMAAREGAPRVTMRNFDEMRDRVMMGSVRTLAIQPEERHRLAVHESGHTVTAHSLAHADPLYKVTIIPRGRALGATQSLPEEERHTLPEEYLRDRLAVMLGGRTAERELLGSISTGADDDIRQATALARAMVSRWGMSTEIGPMDVRDSEEHPFLGREIAQPRRFSDATAHLVDEAVHHLLVQAEERAAQIIREHKTNLIKLIVELEEHETLGRAQIEACLGPARERSADARAESKVVAAWRQR